MHRTTTDTDATDLAFASPDAEGETAAELKSRIEKTPRRHPRLFLGRGDEVKLVRRIGSDALMKRAFAHVTSLADSMLDLEPAKRERVGLRLLFVCRTYLKRVLYLSLVYRLTQDKRYLAKAQDEMVCAAEFSDWNPSHFLDVAEMTTALAIGYDWLWEDLEPEARQTIREAIVEKGLAAPHDGQPWVSGMTNWTQVCHAGLAIGALALMEDEPALAGGIIERALTSVPAAMREYAPDGAYPEGPGYWSYGTTYNVLLISALESSLGTDFGLSKARGFLESSEYFARTTGPTGLLFNYSDCGARPEFSPALCWFAARRKDSPALWRQQDELREFLARRHSPESFRNRFFPFALIWFEPGGEAVPPQPLHWKADGRIPVGLHRSAWNDTRAAFLGIKGGTPGHNHAHMDIGSFVFDADGLRWAVDLGSQNYHSLESVGIPLWDRSQESGRWTVFRLNNLSHNTLVVDEQKQRIDGDAPIIDFSAQGPMPHTIIDMTTVYGDQLASARRGVGLREDRSVLVQDEIEALDRKTTVRWGMVTEADVEITDGAAAILRQDSRELLVRVLAPPRVALEIFETERPPAEHDEPNPGTRMIGFKTTLDPAATTRLVVLLTPGNGAGDPPPVRPLSQW